MSTNEGKGLHREGRYGIQQLNTEAQTWSTCTIWCGYDWDDAVAEVERSNASCNPLSGFRIIDRHTGETFAA